MLKFSPTMVVRAALILLLATAAASAQEPLKKVRFAVGTSVLNIGYPWLNMPRALGYWRQEGLDVEMSTISSSPLQQLAAGNADFVQANVGEVMKANVVSGVQARVIMLNGMFDWKIGVLADSPYKSVQDLKGKTVGTFLLATGGVEFFKQYLRQNGLDPDKDVHIVAVGLGAPPIHALKTGQVQALLYWASAFSQFQNTGLELRLFAGDDWSTYPDFVIATLQSTIDKDPALVESLVRGAAKATAFTFASPDCVRKLQWKDWPDTKPTGSADEAALVKWDLNNLQTEMLAMHAAFDETGKKLYGNALPGGFEKVQDFMIASGQIDHKLPPETYIVGLPEFFEKANDFDVSAIEAEAKTCKVDG